MSKMKKFLTVFISVIMCFALALFTACGNDGNNDKNGVTPSEEEDAVTKFLNALTEQKVANAEVTYSVSGTESEISYLMGEDGEKTKISESLTEIAMEANGKLNLEDGNADFLMHSDKVTTADGDSKALETLEYAFIRDTDLFTYTVQPDSEGKLNAPESFEGKTLTYEGNLGEMIADSAEGSEDILGMISGEIMGGLIELSISAGDTSIVKVANLFGALTVEKDKATIDINKLLYNVTVKIGKIINSINDYTTIGDILENKDFKEIVTPFINQISAEELHTYIVALIAGLSADKEISGMLEEYDIDLSMLNIAPDKNSTAYDYIVKIISSNQLAMVVSKIMLAMGSPIPLMNTLDGLRISTLLSVLSFVKEEEISIETVKADYAEAVSGITEDKFEAFGLSIENAEIVYTLEDYKVTGQTIAMKVTVKDSEEGEMILETEETAEISIEIEYAQTAYELVNIENCNIAGTDDKTEAEILAICA